MKNNTTPYALASLLLFLSIAAWGQDAGSSGDAAANPFFYNQLGANALAITAAVVVIAAIIAMLNLLNIMVKVQQIRIYQEQGMEPFLEEVKKTKEPFWQRMYKRWTDAVPVEKEHDVMLDHNYDGIRELDNSLPPWWVAMFYLSIAFAVVYMSYYHFIGSGPGSVEEYKMEMEQAEQAVQAYLATQSNLVDETNVELLADEASLATGKSIYELNCAACHGLQGEGGVGPNMTDPYWIHGGDIKDVFKTIKYGVPEKGMIAWKSQLSASDMHRVASYILSMQGTTPPNAKEPEGELYQQVENDSPEADSTATGDAIGMNE